MSLVGNSNEEKIWNYLKSKGLNDYGVAGLMGNLYAESALNPQNLQGSFEKKLGYTDASYTAAVDNGKYTNFVKDSAGYGLAQWTYWSRKQNLLNYAKSVKRSIGDLEMQLDFLYKELSEGYKSVLSVLKSATSVLQASNSVLLNYEKPADQSSSVQTKRAGYGQTYYDKYVKSSSTNSESTVATTMTENELRQKVVDTAIKYLNYKESDGSHKKIIDIYNSHTPLARGYKVKYTDAWCATYVSAISILCGLTDIMPTECGCGAMIELYQKLGRWVENDAYVPKTGDLIMYYWNDNGVGDCTGYPNHVGIVVSVSGSTIKVIEGNKSDAVGYRTISVNGRYIRGYCIPNYASKATSSTSKTSSNSNSSANSSSSSSKPNTSSTINSSSTTSSTLNKTVKWNGYVTADSLNVRTWAGTENDTCSFSPIKKNTVVGVCDSVKAKNGVIWYYIKYNNKYGFVSSQYIQKQLSNDSGSASSNTGTKTVKVDYAQSSNNSLAGTYKTTTALNLRAGAGTGKSIICVIPQGDKVTCYGYYTSVGNTKWYLVAYKTYKGFVSSQYLKR